MSGTSAQTRTPTRYARECAWAVTTIARGCARASRTTAKRTARGSHECGLGNEREPRVDVARARRGAGARGSPAADRGPRVARGRATAGRRCRRHRCRGAPPRRRCTRRCGRWCRRPVPRSDRRRARCAAPGRSHRRRAGSPRPRRATGAGPTTPTRDEQRAMAGADERGPPFDRCDVVAGVRAAGVRGSPRPAPRLRRRRVPAPRSCCGTRRRRSTGSPPRRCWCGCSPAGRSASAPSSPLATELSTRLSRTSRRQLADGCRDRRPAARIRVTDHRGQEGLAVTRRAHVRPRDHRSPSRVPR